MLLANLILLTTGVSGLCLLITPALSTWPSINLGISGSLNSVSIRLVYLIRRRTNLSINIQLPPREVGLMESQALIRLHNRSGLLKTVVPCIKLGESLPMLMAHLGVQFRSTTRIRLLTTVLRRI